MTLTKLHVDTAVKEAPSERAPLCQQRCQIRGHNRKVTVI